MNHHLQVTGNSLIQLPPVNHLDLLTQQPHDMQPLIPFRRDEVYEALGGVSLGFDEVKEVFFLLYDAQEHSYAICTDYLWPQRFSERKVRDRLKCLNPHSLGSFVLLINHANEIGNVILKLLVNVPH